MIDPISASSAVHSLARLELVSIAPVTPPSVSAADQAQFQNALRAPLEASVAATLPLLPDPPATLTPGEVILRGLDKLRTGYRDLNGQIEATSQHSDLAPQDLLNLHMQVNQVMLGAQLVTQVAGKIQQELSNLLRSS